MLIDDFFWRAVIAGIGISIVTGPLGCFVIWKRMSYLGDTMAHSALLGIAFGIYMGFNMILGVFAISVTVGTLLFFLQNQNQLSNDSILGILSHASLAIGVLVISTMYWVRVDFMGFLFNRLHIHRGNRKLSEIFMGTSNFRFLTRKPNISSKY